MKHHHEEIVVFSGPSVYGMERSQFRGMCWMPPAGRGDLLRLLPSHPKIVVIIDGYFMDSPSIGHQEIVKLIAEGVIIYGCASMGALRAVELRDEGMLGRGEVFRMFVEGAIQEDSEVAVLHADVDSQYRPLTFALVDLRITLKWLVETKRVEVHNAVDILETAAELPFHFRHLRDLADLFTLRERSDLIEDLRSVRCYWRSQKLEDARELLTFLHKGRAIPKYASRSLAGTTWLRSSMLRHGVCCGSASDWEVLATARLFVPNYTAIHWHAMADLLMAQEVSCLDSASLCDLALVRRLADEFTARYSERYVDSLRLDAVKACILSRVSGLPMGSALGLAPTECAEVEEERLLTLREPSGDLPVGYLLDVLKEKSVFSEMCSRAEEIRYANRCYAEKGHYEHLDGVVVLRAFKKRVCASDGAIAAFWVKRGFVDPLEFLNALKFAFAYSRGYTATGLSILNGLYALR